NLNEFSLGRFNRGLELGDIYCIFITSISLVVSKICSDLKNEFFIMNYIQQRFKVSFEYKVFFTEGLFSSKNPIFNEVLKEDHQENYSKKILFVIDDKIIENFPDLDKQIDDYFEGNEYVQLIKEKIVVAGGEVSKNDTQYLEKVVDAVNRNRIDRHSYIVGIGGGSVLDLTGYAAAISHRGIKVIRIPTTVLSQNDSGVGVKNGVNYKGKKNFLGTFA